MVHWYQGAANLRSFVTTSPDGTVHYAVMVAAPQHLLCTLPDVKRCASRSILRAIPPRHRSHRWIEEQGWSGQLRHVRWTHSNSGKHDDNTIVLVQRAAEDQLLLKSVTSRVVHVIGAPRCTTSENLVGVRRQPFFSFVRPAASIAEQVEKPTQDDLRGVVH